MAIQLLLENHLAIVTLERPEALNALSFDIMRELNGVLDRIEASEARALVIIGSGDRAFSVGADILELRDRSISEQQRSTLFGQGVMSRLEALSIPSLAMINGYAFGGGLELALSCTFRLASADAKMGLPEIKLGLIPGYGGTQRLPRLIGHGRAMDLILSGRTVAAEEAERIGLVHRVVNGDLMESARAFLKPLLNYSQLVSGFARSAVTRALDQPLAEGLKIEADLSTLAFQTRDADEGMTAFIEKRPPRFIDA